MNNNKLRVCFLVLAVVLGCQFLAGDSRSDRAGIDCPCVNQAVMCHPTGDRMLIVCPAGDGSTLADGGNEICIQVTDCFGNPYEGIAASDFWLTGCTSLVLAGFSESSAADQPTDANGYTTMSGAVAAGGSDSGLFLVCQGVVLAGCPAVCLPVTVVSPDIDGDLDVDLVDFALFAPHFTSPPNLYNWRVDYDGNGAIRLVDFSIFAQHWQHQH